MRSPRPKGKEREDALATLEDARNATIAAESLKGVRDFWPDFEAAVRRERKEQAAPAAVRPGWRWALGTAGLLTVLGIVLLVPSLVRRTPRPAGPLEPPLPFRVDSVMYEEKPAQAFVFHTDDPDITYVWVERQL